jgi:probable biosynthetic protein (TIGR04098 family)
VLIETAELTLSLVGLGNLSEFPLMVLFATAQARSITAGKEISINQIVDKNGEALYPAYYLTHLVVPPSRLLGGFRAWEKISIGVDVSSYGGMLLESSYVAGYPNEVAENSKALDAAPLPSMRASAMFVVDRNGEQQVSVPRSGALASLPKLETSPAALNQFRKARIQSNDSSRHEHNLRAQGPITYPIIAGRDAAPGPNRVYAGHPVIFAKFIEVMDHAERVLLSEHVWPPFHTALIDCMSVLERETYYFGACQADSVLRVHITGRLMACPPNLHGKSAEIISAGILTFVIEVYQQDNNALLAMSNVRKLLAVPSAQQSLLRDAERLLSHTC